METTSEARLAYVTEKLELTPRMVAELLGVPDGADVRITKDIADAIDKVFGQVKIACESLHYRQVIEGRKTNKGEEILHLKAGTFCTYFQGILDGPKDAPKALCDVKPGEGVKLVKTDAEAMEAFELFRKVFSLNVSSTSLFLGCFYYQAEAWLEPQKYNWKGSSTKERHRLANFRHQLEQALKMPEGQELFTRRRAGEDINILLVQWDLQELNFVSRLASEPNRYYYTEEEKKKKARDRERTAKRLARQEKERKAWEAGELERRRKRDAERAKAEALAKAEAAKSKSLKSIEGVLFQLDRLDTSLAWTEAQLQKEGPQTVPEEIVVQLTEATQKLNRVVQSINRIKQQVRTAKDVQLDAKRREIQAAKARKLDEKHQAEQAEIRAKIAKAPVEKMAELAERMAELGRERRKLQKTFA